MKKLVFPFLLVFALNALSQTNTFPTSGSAGIGTLSPNASAILDIVSTNKGILLPRMTIAQRNLIASPATGLLIYQTNSTPGVYFYNGIAWAQISAGKASSNLNNLSAVTAVSQSLLPGTTNSIDLGSSTKTWKDLYLGGNANVSGTATVSKNLIVTGTGTYDLTGASNYSDFRLGDASYNLKMGVANAGGGSGDAYIAGSGRLYLGTQNTFARTQTIAINPDGTVGVGSYVANAKLGVTGDTGSAAYIPVISATSNYAGNSDVRGIQSYSVAAPGYGYGVYATGGYMGLYGVASGGSYTGTDYGVYGNATGSTAGTRIGVYGTASGASTSEANWGGYFPTKTYTNELRVGGTKGSTGFVACINGKLIATEVRVQPTASWPDYVFSKDYKLMSLEELEAKINADKHLPNVPAAVDVKENGIMLGEMQTKAMEKIEELTLYMIELSKQNKDLKKEIENLKILVNAKK